MSGINNYYHFHRVWSLAWSPCAAHTSASAALHTLLFPPASLCPQLAFGRKRAIREWVELSWDSPGQGSRLQQNVNPCLVLHKSCTVWLCTVLTPSVQKHWGLAGCLHCSKGTIKGGTHRKDEGSLSDAAEARRWPPLEDAPAGIQWPRAIPASHEFKASPMVVFLLELHPSS